MRSAFAVLLVLAAVADVAAAAPADPVADLKARVAELERVLAELPSALDSLHDLDQRLSTLQRAVDELGIARASDDDVRRALDSLRADLDGVEQRLVRTQLRVNQHTATVPVSFGYDDGVFLHSAPVDVTLNAGVQPRYTAVIRPPPVENGSSFELHHAQLALGASIIELIDVRAMFDFGAEFTTAGGLAMVRDLYLDVRPVKWLTVRGGRFRVPFGRQRITGELRQTFVDRSLATRALTFDYDQGALVEVRFWDAKLVAELAVTNGASSATEARNENLDLAYTARVVVQPLGALELAEGDRARMRKPRFAIGAAVQYNLSPTDLPPPLNDVEHTGRIDNVELLSFGAEAVVKWRGVAVEGEYFLRHERPGFGRPDRLYQGGYAQASGMVWRGLEVAARFSYTELPGLRPPAIGVLGDTPSRALEAGGVVNWYLWGENVKGQLGYAYQRDRASDPFDVRRHEGHILEAQVQAGF
jgi:Phosphate-selective porin O and P